MFGERPASSSESGRGRRRATPDDLGPRARGPGARGRGRRLSAGALGHAVWRTDGRVDRGRSARVHSSAPPAPHRHAPRNPAARPRRARPAGHRQQRPGRRRRPRHPRPRPAPRRSVPRPTPPAPAAPKASAPPAKSPPPKAPADPRPGRLLVRSNPAGAEVFVNGTRRGVTPLALRDLPLGGYDLRVNRAGFTAAEQRVTLDAGRPSRTVDVSLRRAAAAAARRPRPRRRPRSPGRAVCWSIHGHPGRGSPSTAATSA